MKKYCSIILVSLLLSSCVVDRFPKQYNDGSFSTATYVKNTLDYPVLVQCYFQPFNDNSFWCENELIAYSEPIEIQPNECKIVMDYILPTGIKIYKGSDNSLLFESFELKKWEQGLPVEYLAYCHLPQGILSYSSEGAKEIGSFTAKQVVPENWSEAFRSEYYIRDEKYLCQNVPWSLYPICFEFWGCNEHLLENNEHRKDIYKELTNGYAIVNCITFNKYAACFNP